MNNVEEQIRAKLQQAFLPTALDVRNVSHRHAAHASSPATGQSHFEVDLVSAEFTGMTKVASHRRVYQVLREEMAGPVHALALTTRSPEGEI